MNYDKNCKKNTWKFELRLQKYTQSNSYSEERFLFKNSMLYKLFFGGSNNKPAQCI